MKLLLTIMLTVLVSRVSAQTLNGLLLDSDTGRPVANASIITPSTLVFSSSAGVFSIQKPYPGDTLKITCIGYKPARLIVGALIRDTLRISLEQNSILLQQVNVSAKHDPRLDSIRLRNEFSNVFGYKGPSAKDAIMGNSSTAYTPDNYIAAPNNATSLAGVNLLSVVSMLTKNSTSTARLQKTMERDEGLNYVDQKFSKQKVTRLTNLKGDSLIDFVDKYRPTTDQIKAMSDYDLIIYIKKSYEEFLRTYKKGEKSIFTQP